VARRAAPLSEVIVTARRHLPLLLAGVLAACGGGSSPTRATPTPSGAVVVSVVDGSGQPVPGVSLRVDGVDRAAQAGSPASFALDRSLVGHALEIEKAGFLLHQNLVPTASRALDLFAVPASADKPWVKLILYDGTINTSGRLARLTRPVSIVRGASVPPADWASVLPLWQEAAARMSSVTGFSFQVAEAPASGTSVYTVELAPALKYWAYFQWFGSHDTIESGTVQFLNQERLGQLNLILHELTHGFGLSHSNLTDDLMYPLVYVNAHSPRELAVVDAVRRRPAGTSWEDDVRGATAALSERAASRAFGCGGRP